MKIYPLDTTSKEYKKAKKKNPTILGLVGWTSYYCPVKHCEKIIYNNLDLPYKKTINKHLKVHGLKSL